jgi:hypothetical protein
MGLFGSSRPKFGAGIVATPEQEAESQRLAQQFGLGAPSMSPQMDMPAPMQQAAPQQPQRWAEGGKFGGKDALALALAAVSDVAAQRNGYQGDAMSGLFNARNGAKEAQQRALMAQQQRMQGREDYAWKAQYDAANPGAPNDQFIQRMKAAGYDPASPEGQALLRQKVATDAMPAPSLIGSPDTGYRWAQPPAPTFGGGAPAPTASVPTVSDEAGYAALQPGAQYRDPSGNLRTKGGGAGNGAGGFPAPSGNPLEPFRR